ncbi:MAG: cupin domain-containing protein [Eggerthellaceae bacterium]|nr:cupin domain-containing protein [Eggerthellaceae bacterium]
MPLRNLPEETAASLAGLIEARPGQVSSCALTRDAGFDMTLLAFAPGESVSEEEYFGDTLYYVVEGAAAVALPERTVRVGAGEVLKVPAHVLHAVEGADGAGFKLLQVTLHAR